LRFAWLKQLPYLFANACEAQTAQKILHLWEQTPKERHHRVTIHNMGLHFDALRSVSQGGLPSPELQEEERIWQAAPLNEAPIEGYHAEVAKVCARAHAGKAPYVFAEIRMLSNIARIRRWTETPENLAILAFEWSRYKRVVRVGDAARRSLKCKLREFRDLFYRLRDEAPGAVHELVEQWCNRAAPPLLARTTSEKLRDDFVNQLVQPGSFFTVKDITNRSQVRVFMVLRKYSGHEKHVNLGTRRTYETSARSSSMTFGGRSRRL